MFLSVLSVLSVGSMKKNKQHTKTVDGDSRYAKAKFKHIKTTNALKMWSNKEYRNLIRMHRAGIPCKKVTFPGFERLYPVSANNIS